jgi:hypothetical protein
MSSFLSVWLFHGLVTVANWRGITAVARRTLLDVSAQSFFRLDNLRACVSRSAQVAVPLGHPLIIYFRGAEKGHVCVSVLCRANFCNHRRFLFRCGAVAVPPRGWWLSRLFEPDANTFGVGAQLGVGGKPATAYAFIQRVFFPYLRMRVPVSASGACRSDVVVHVISLCCVVVAIQMSINLCIIIHQKYIKSQVFF